TNAHCISYLGGIPKPQVAYVCGQKELART
ncbi:unnamed protein product, partial [marine sediment metagenome]